MKKKSFANPLVTVFLTAAATLFPMAHASNNPSVVTVVIERFAYRPKELTLKVGTTVMWVNKDEVEHSATANDESFDTALFGQGKSATITFSKAGRFNYYCAPHPFMKGAIVVEE